MTEHAAYGCSGKRRYRDNVAAMYALSQIQWRGKDGHDEQRVYQCAYCKGLPPDRHAPRERTTMNGVTPSGKAV